MRQFRTAFTSCTLLMSVPVFVADTKWREEMVRPQRQEDDASNERLYTAGNGFCFQPCKFLSLKISNNNYNVRLIYFAFIHQVSQ
jgi:hypothetical protein